MTILIWGPDSRTMIVGEGIVGTAIVGNEGDPEQGGIYGVDDWGPGDTGEFSTEEYVEFQSVSLRPSPDGRYGGVISIEGTVYLSDVNNVRGEAIENIDQGSVRWNVDSLIPSSLELRIRDLTNFEPYKTMLAPVMSISYLDPENPGTRVTLEDQLGLFVVLPVNRDHIGADTNQSVVAYDTTWFLAQRSTPSSVTLPVGTNPITYIRTILNTLGLRHRLVSTTHTLTKEFTWRPGTTWITITNDLLNAIGYYQIWADRHGILVSMPIRALADVQSQASFTTDMGDVGEHVTLEPDQLYIRNDIIIIGNAPSNDPIIARRTNVDHDSPTSIYGLRSSDDADPVYLTLVEEDSSIETQAAANALAKRYLEERSSFFYRMSVELVPRTGLDLHEPVDFYIETDAGHIAAEGKWWWSELTIHFTDESGAMSMRCNKIIDWEVAV